jgi:3-oxoacyl-[acyl-carrier protein] reductase
VFAGDLTKPGVPDELVQKVVDEWGKVDILINNAGYTLDAPIHKMSDEWFQRMLDIHTIVPFRMCRAVAPHMREPAKQEREEGREVFRKIVNVSSISGTMGNPGQANYSSGKAGVVGLTKTLAKEWGQFKINVNAVAFGFIDTRLTQAKVDENVMEIGGETVQLGIPEQMRQMASVLIPLGRPASPAEAAGAIFFLCSPSSNYVHGQTLHVTGGMFGGMTGG